MEEANQLNAELREVLNRFVDRQMSLDELQDALDALESRAAQLDRDTYASWAIDQVDITLAEILLGHRTEADLVSMLRDEILLRPSTFEVNLGSTGAVSTVTEAVNEYRKKELVAA